MLKPIAIFMMLALGFAAAADDNLTRIECFNQKIKVSLTQSDSGATMSVLVAPDKINNFSIEAKGIGMAKDALLAQVIRVDLGIVTAVGVSIDKNGGAKKTFELTSVPQSFVHNKHNKELSFQAQLNGDVVQAEAEAPNRPIIVNCHSSYEAKVNP